MRFNGKMIGRTHAVLVLLLGTVLLATARASGQTTAPTTGPATLPAAVPATDPTSDATSDPTSDPISVTGAAPVTKDAQAADSPADAWSTLVCDFASALTDNNGSSALESMLNENATIHQFNRPGPRDIAQLHVKTMAAKLIGAHGYLQTPTTMAGDLAADVRDAPAVSDAVKKQFTPDGDEAMKRANETAAKWIAASLLTSGTDPIGVIVLWSKSADPAPIFVLLRGDLVDGHFRISQICYGDPVPASSADSNVAGAGD